jgi:imidazoleglycerol phosphate dehydratase HisB
MIAPVVRIERRTRETRVAVELGGTASGVRIATPVPMFSHLLVQLGFYWGVGLMVTAEDLQPLGDSHHLAEDTALGLGRALADLLGDRSGRRRYGQRWLPMDDALALAVVDIGGRSWLSFEADFPASMLGGLACENIGHFFDSLSRAASLTLHLKVTGRNAHHMAEALFKAAGLALAEAMAPWDGGVRSTKGVLA